MAHDDAKTFKNLLDERLFLIRQWIPHRGHSVNSTN